MPTAVPTPLETEALPQPYLLFLGDTVEPAYAKTAFGLRDWARDRCVGEFALPSAQVSTGLPFLSRNTVTVVPYYENGPLQARVSYNRRSKYFYRIGRLQSQDYTAAYRQLDAQISYNLNKAVSFTASASNLLDETYYQYSSTPDAPTSIYKNGRIFSLSATLRM
jgi:iron complex outermembrane receptor protein